MTSEKKRNNFAQFEVVYAMILILSMESDVSTISVIDWLDYLCSRWKRVNGEDIDETQDELFLKIANDELPFCTLLDGIDHHQVTAVWDRRFHGLNRIRHWIYSDTSDIGFNNARLEKLLIAEVGKVHAYTHTFFSDCFWLDTAGAATVNKLNVLDCASKVGLKIPRTVVTNKKDSLIAAFSGCEIITKHISEAHGLFFDATLFMNYTAVVTKEFVDTLPETFFPSLFQEKIEKKYEIRAFYLMGIIYAMAIFSQSSEQTKVDFRQYDFSNSNRMVPFELPLSVQAKINDLMERLNLKHGSIDLIKSVDDEYVFLEVNPVGQFGMVSHPCNYYLEEKVAQTLSEYGK